MSDFGDWFTRIPFFTRWWLALTVGFTMCGRFKILKGHQLVLLYEPFIKQFQIWRPVTALFYYPLTPLTGFNFLINCYFLYNYSQRLEKGMFDGRPGDYLFMLLFNWACCVTVGLIGDIPLLMTPMVLSILYVWCQLNKDIIVSFWFGTRFKAKYLPWVLFAFNFIISGGGILELVGILVGHLYFFLTFKYPQELGGPALLTTPSIIYHFFPNEQRGGIRGFGEPPASRRPDNGGGRHDWGRGHVLGDN